jgi:amino acid adenylation domain-containing protein
MTCLHHLIEAQAARTPEHPAVAFEGETLSYAELERRAGRLAAQLRARGAGPDVPVGLFVERSIELIVSLLGILKAGAAYVPMDTAYPRERLAFMVCDAGMGLIVTQASLAAKLPASPARAVQLEEIDWDGAAEAAHSNACETNLAYVIYTSGSTGRPKGVGVEHRNIVNYVRGIVERLRLEPGMSYATVSTFAADLGNTVVFPALATGGCLHVVSQARAESQALLSEYFVRERIDVLKIVPSHLAALQSGSDPQRVMPARRLVLGGEPSRLEWIERLRSLSPHCQIFNHYGPTEATVGVLAYEVGAALPQTKSHALPLGYPLPGSSIHLLDDHGRAVAPGEKGELCIGGRGVARGYLNRPELTAEKFVPDPFSDEPQARLYRTGDLARALADGSIEFCGRIDHQVKLHGYRVELGEIEAALRSHDRVQEAVVLVREDAAGDKQVAAFVTAKEAQPAFFAEELTPAGLREYLKERLPQYMVPSAFVLMERLPLTANGKIDRQGLVAFALERQAQSEAPAADFVAPRTETEKALASIWSELLQREHVGVHDDVFDLGAHSLMAMRALTRMREAFGLDLALRNLFERPTVAGLAELVEGAASLNRPPATNAQGGAREEIVL